MSSNSEPRTRSRLKNLARNLAVFATSFLLCFLVAEVIFRILGYGNVEIYEPDPLLYWRLKPNQACYTKVDHKPVRVNSLGTRGREFEADKPAGTLRILSLGDSRTFGWGLAEAETYSSLIEAGLQERFGNRTRVEVINAGVNAWSYAQMHVFFRERALKWKPDVVLVASANYWTQFSESNSPEFVKQFMSRVRLKNLLRRSALYHFVVEVQLKDVYERYRTKFIPVNPEQDALFKEQQQSDPDAAFREAITSLCQAARQHGVKPVLVYIPMLTELESGRSDRDLQIKTNVSTRLSVPLVDLTSSLAPRSKALYLDADPVHLNPAGNEIIANQIVEALAPLVTP